MWSRVGVDDDDLLRRCLAMAAVAEPQFSFGDFGERLAHLRFEVASEAVELYHYQGDGFEIAANFRYRRKNDRYIGCYCLDGDLDPHLALDLIIERSLEFGRMHGIDQLYGLEPRTAGSTSLKQLYDLSASHPQVQKELLSEMSDVRLYRLTYRERGDTSAQADGAIAAPSINR